MKLAKLPKHIAYVVYGICALIMVLFLVPITGWKALSVPTGSMRPVLTPGSLAIIHRVSPQDLKVGDIATYINPSNQTQTITHRIVDIQAGNPISFTFRGDANPTRDPQQIVGGRIVGKLIFSVPAIGNVASWAKRPLGLALFIIVPGLIIIIYELTKLGKIIYGGEPAKGSSMNKPPNYESIFKEAEAEISTPKVSRQHDQQAISSGQRARSMDGMRRQPRKY